QLSNKVAVTVSIVERTRVVLTLGHLNGVQRASRHRAEMRRRFSFAHDASEWFAWDPHEVTASVYVKSDSTAFQQSCRHRKRSRKKDTCSFDARTSQWFPKGIETSRRDEKKRRTWCSRFQLRERLRLDGGDEGNGERSGWWWI
nr:hypothetical protein [Tanacetum cinerariifolium]